MTVRRPPHQKGMQQPAQPPACPPARRLDLSAGPLRAHIVGIGGAHMSAIATVLVAMGHSVSGSDAEGSPVLASLDEQGVRTCVGHDAANVGDVDIVAFSSAVQPGNVELVEARRRGLPTLRRGGAACGHLRDSPHARCGGDLRQDDYNCDACLGAQRGWHGAFLPRRWKAPYHG